MNIPILATRKTLNAALETWFIQNVIFSGSPYYPEFYPIFDFGNTAIYVELYEIDTSIIRRLKSQGKKVVLYHMGDERFDKEIVAYAQCDLVIRNYFSPKIINKSTNSKIMWAPNGFRTGVGPRQTDSIKLSGHRRHLSSFLGWLTNTSSHDNERNLFSDIAKNCHPHLNLLGSSGFSNGYNVGLYSAIMEDSIFAPCPAGNSPETIRLYDALESGCIPISLDHEFIKSTNALSAIGTPPFKILNNWNELPEFLIESQKKLEANPEIFNHLQSECILWWDCYKKYLMKNIKNEISNLVI
jgi:hypothetical protein